MGKTPADIARQAMLEESIDEYKTNLDMAEALFVHCMTQDLDANPQEVSSKTFEAIRVFSRFRRQYKNNFFRSRGLTLD